MEPRLLAAVLGHRLDGLAVRKAVAPGFRAVVYPGRIYPGLVPGEGAADGLAIVGLSEADMAILDAFEGDEYVRDRIGIALVDRDDPGLFLAIEAGKDKLAPAEYYRPVAAIGEDAPAWRFEEWRRAHGERMVMEEGEAGAAIRERFRQAAKLPRLP